MQLSKFISTLSLMLILSVFCFSQDVTLSTQADVDAFDPSTTTINGNLFIGVPVFPVSTSDINDLSNLSNLQSIAGDLFIGFTNVTHVDNFSNLTTISGNSLSIRDNETLTNVNGFSNLTSFNGSLAINSNDILSNIDGLSNFTSLSALSLGNNHSLLVISDFSNLTSVGDFSISNNDGLTNINGFSNLSTVTGFMSILNNDELLDINGFSNLNSIYSLYISDNYGLLSISGFPNLTSISNNLIIQNNEVLSDIFSFSNLNSIGRNLYLKNNLTLSDISGFSTLVSIEKSLYIQNNNSLSNLDAFSNLTSNSSIYIQNNSSLINIDGLLGLDSIGSLYITDNPQLPNVDGLLNLITIDTNLLIQNNNILSNLDGFSNLASIDDNLQIQNNSVLDNCCGIQLLLVTPNAIGGNVTIENNLTSCDNPTAILDDECGNNINIIEGNVFLDIDANCLFDQGDILYENIIVQAESPEYTYTTVTDSIGDYKIYLDTGAYEVRTFMANPYTEACTPSFNVDILDDTVSDTFNFDFPTLINTECPYLEVDLGTWALRECFDNIYHVQYCNSGTIDATDAYVELALDDVLTIADASIPFTGPDINNIYTFDVGTVAIGDCGTFNVNIQLPCDTLNTGAFLGQTLCVNAHIYPDSICLPPPSFWDGSSVQVTGECDQDSVVFRVQNIGTGDMIPGKSLQVFEDQVMFIDDPYQLQSGEEIVFSYFANGSTFRLDAEQSDGHPGMSQPSVVVEGCGAGPIFSLGFVNQFSQDDGDVFVSSECREVTGSYDPNDKQAFPIGYGDEHYIEQNTDIEYLIRFQNTGTDTAFTVVIQDELSPLFDITTIQPGASSHPYTFEIDTVVRFVFNDILLVDSFTNEAASHGFVKFRISQEADLPIGTVIENTAEIYFDFNAPIITNTTFHTIGENFVTINLINDVSDDFKISSVKAYPNPFLEVITFELEGIFEDEIILSVYDLNGKEVARKNYDSNIFQFNRGELSSGVYFYNISSSRIRIANGKMILFND